MHQAFVSTQHLRRPKVCRICRAPDDDDLISVLLVQECVTIAQMIQELTGVKVMADKCLPQNICLACLERLRSAFQLRQQCIDSDQIFQRELYSQCMKEESQAVVKLEIETLSSEEQDADLRDDEEDSGTSSAESNNVGKHNSDKLEEQDDDTRTISAKELIAILAPEEKDSVQLRQYEETDCEIVYQSKHYERIKFVVAQCCGCPQSFRDKKELLAHSQMSHRPYGQGHNSQNDLHQCSVCYGRFRDIELNASHRDHIDFERYRCRVCDQLLGSKGQIVNHLQGKHSIELENDVDGDFDVVDSGEQGTINLTDFHSSQYKLTNVNQDYELVEFTGICCCGCLEIFNTREEFELHSSEVHLPQRITEDDINPFECSVCFQRFTKKGSLALHKIRPHRRRIVCRLCRKIFKNESTYQKHMISCHSVVVDARRNLKPDMELMEIETEVDQMQHSEQEGSIYGSERNKSENYGMQEVEYIEDLPEEIERVVQDDSDEDSEFEEDDMNEFGSVQTKEKNSNKYLPTRQRKEMGRVPGNVLRVIEQLDGYNIVEILKERCCRCLKFFDSIEKLDEHTKLHQEESLAFESSDKPIKYQCDYCLKQFDIALVYVVHKRIREQKQFYQCRLCDFIIDSESRLKNHMLHNDQHAKFFNLIREDVSDRYDVVKVHGTRCCGCGRYFDSEESLIRHSQQHHPRDPKKDSLKRTHVCKICDKRCYNKSEVEAHRKKNGSTVRYYCKLCQFGTPNEARMLKHLYSSIHNQALPSIEVKNIEVGFRKAGTLRYCCFEGCNLPFHDSQKMQEHIDGSHRQEREENIATVGGEYSGNRLQCDCCFLVFRTVALLKQHQFSNREPKSYVCSVCGEAKLNKTALTAHEMRHTGERPYGCCVCGKSFSSQTILNSHMKCHVPKQYQCNECGEKFARGENLKRHIRHRHSEATFCCTYCPRKLKTREAQVLHERSHTGEKPFSCRTEGCEKRYASITDRRRHEMATHTGERPHSCSYCSASFVRKRQLTIHERKHTGERPFVCGSCGKAFVDAPLLRRHTSAKMVRCAVVGCKNYEGDNHCLRKFKYFVFPKDEQLCRVWVEKCGKNDFDPKKAKLCSNHFGENDYRLKDVMLNSDWSKWRLRKGVVPNLNLPNNDDSGQDNIDKDDRKRIVQQAIEEHERERHEMQPMQDFCRICARCEPASKSLVCIHSTTLEYHPRKVGYGTLSVHDGIETDSGGSLVQTVAEIMAKCLDANIKPDDKLPQRICDICLLKLKESWEFKEIYKASDRYLEQMFRKTLNVIKHENGKEETSDQEDFTTEISFVREDVSADDEFSEAIEARTHVNKKDPLISEQWWMMSDLTEGHYEVKQSDNPSWELVEVDDFRCCGCFQFFSYKSDLDEHCKLNHCDEQHGDETKHYECGVCLKLFSSTDALNFHQRMARSKKLFHCKSCNALLPSKRQLNTHLKLHASVESEIDLKTESHKTNAMKSKKTAGVYSAMKTNIILPPADKCRITKHFVTFDYMAFDGFCCCECMAYCESRREMKRHGEKEHYSNRGLQAENECFACLRSFGDKDASEQHMKELNSRHIYHCKMCNLIFRSLDQIHDHQQTSANHEGFIEAEIIDGDEDIGDEDLRFSKRSFRGQKTATIEQITVYEDNDTLNENEEYRDEDANYDPADGEDSQQFDEPYGRRLYAPKVKRNDPDIAEVTVVDISSQDAVRCCGCYQTFITEEEIVDHSNHHHLHSQVQEDKDRPYGCDRCYRRFGKAVSLQIHKLFVKNVQIYTCKLCDEKFSFQTPFLLHYNEHERHSMRDDKRGAKPRVREEVAKFYCCFNLCKQSFTEYSELLSHVDDNHGVKRNQFKDYRDTDENCCEVCFRSFNNYRALLRHVTHQKKSISGRHTCSTCGVQMKSLASLKDHENRHLGIKPYECEVCSKTFGTKTILKNHMIVHQTDRPFSCEICGKTFARKRNWKDHSMTHTDGKPWECEVCKLTFRIESQFLTHKRRHTGVRPYKCKFCDKVFSHATDRKRHEMAAHTGEKPHQCSFCPLAFIRKRQLVIHERTHTGEKPYECQSCGQAFIQQSYLTRHLATHKPRDGGAV
ncbi:zinc finger protein Xfin-like [Toxorhynchites rutilus septentrionalis]|uniref:zinc finger protein Xfin-like n=1 Tax=Toxorhynchites rutilus septentrionalis TaxID=329112 RepID=UPI0024796C11|nr:zinc finger protein Xfin-like [Toxorhynchites rutilus septentrionalis]